MPNKGGGPQLVRNGSVFELEAGGVMVLHIRRVCQRGVKEQTWIEQVLEAMLWCFT